MLLSASVLGIYQDRKQSNARQQFGFIVANTQARKLTEPDRRVAIKRKRVHISEPAINFANLLNPRTRDKLMGILQRRYSLTELAEETEVNEPAAAAMLPAIQGLQIGVVTAIESDPDGEARIKVKLPLISTGEDGLWARQATDDAGNNRGWVIHPEIGDEVIVGFINADPRDPIVLGSLHSSANTAPIAAKDDNDEKGWVTRSGIKMLIDDKKKRIEISTPAGNVLIMDEDAKTITLQDQNNNKMEMSSDGVKIESAKDIILKATGDIKADGINIELKASASLKGEGSASAEIKSSGNTTVKGGIVMIN